MSTTKAAQAATTEAPKANEAPTTTPAAPRQPKSFSVSLTSAAGEVLRITAIRRRQGASTHVVRTEKVEGGKPKHERGVTAAHPSMDAAKTAVDKLVAEAVKLGWAKRDTGRGYEARPDSFDAIPKPKAAAPKIVQHAAKSRKSA